MEKKSDKRVVQDIVATGRRTIRRVESPRLERISRNEVREEPEEIEDPIEEVEEADIEEKEEKVHIRRVRTIPERAPAAPVFTKPRKKKRFPKILIAFLVIFVSIAIIAVALSLLYSKAVVTINPKIAKFDVNATLTAKKTNDASLVYVPLTVSESLSQNIPATDGPAIETKAKGTLTLYNEQLTPQKIIAGTRVQNADGLIYKTTETVVIPQLKVDKTPGSIAVTILADEASSKYNMALTTSVFKVVAYQGTPKYTTVYGKLKTPLTGGYSGNKKTITPATEAAAIQALKDTLKAKLLTDARSQVPKDSVLYDTAYTIEYEVGDPVTKDAQSADLPVKGTLYGAQFKKTDLLKAAAGKDLDKFAAPTYAVSGIEDLRFAVINAKDFSAKTGTPLIFSLKGPVTLTGTFSDVSLKDELKGTYLKDSSKIFAHYPAISNAYALITPFWMRYFPSSQDKITIETKP